MSARKNTTPAPAPAAPAEPKAKKAPELRPCGCGCGEKTPRRFRPGHDARIPMGATCASCDAKATMAAGKTPACDTHLASVARKAATSAANGRIAVRAL